MSATNIVESDLRKRESNILEELRTIRRIEEDNQSRRKTLFIEWADILERQIESGVIAIKKKGIATRMARIIRTHGGTEGEIVYMYDCLPFEYKSNQEVEALEAGDPLSNKYYCEESKAKRNELFRCLKYIKEFPREHLSRGDHQDLYSGVKEILEQQLDSCEDRHIPVLDTTSADQSDLFEIPDRFTEKYSIQSGESGESYFYRMVGEVIKAFQTFQKMTYKFKPSDEDALKWGEGLASLLYLIAPYTDLKWRADWIQWHKILSNRIEYSLHGAMSMSKLETDVKGVMRGITREQIDAKMLTGFKFFGKITNLKWLWAMHEFYKKYPQPAARGMTVRANEMMSHKS